MKLKTEMKDLLPPARGDAPADLLLKNGRIVNVFSGQIEEGNVAITGERIAGIGDYSQAKTVIDLEGRYLAPGFIDGHTHLESTMLDVGEYARAVVAHGTTAVVTDLHEIANVSGLAGIRYIMEQAIHLPLELFLMAPSCVPATHLETAGAVLGVEEIRQLLEWPNCLGLGEVMNYPGVIFGDPTMLAKIALAQGKIIDGHAPGLSGHKLNAYLATGIMSDHESVTYAEGKEKLERGMMLMIREGASEKNLEALLPLVTDQTYTRCCFVVDDRSSVDLLKDGDIDAVVRKAIRLGLEPLRAIQLATINTARYFRLAGLGAVAPGYLADLIVLDDLSALKINTVFYRGKRVAQDGQALFAAEACHDQTLMHSIRIKPFDVMALKLAAKNETCPVIEVAPGQIITGSRNVKMKLIGGFVESDPSRDILKLVVVERHNATGRIGRGLVSGFGLKHGALASSIAHDSHNIVAVGTNDADIHAAVKAIEAMQGGLVAVSEGRVLASLAAPIAGLLSTQPMEKVADEMETLESRARDLGCDLPAPFATLSFLALPVIPSLRLTDLGLVDVNAFKLIE
jgi:adenine deaminase